MTKHRKPSGSTGYIEAGRGAPPKFHKFQFHPLKDRLENQIIADAIATAEVVCPTLFEMYGRPIQNPEDHFDFTLRAGNRTEYLDLVEIVGAKGYAADGRYFIGEYVDRLFELVKKKSKKYGLSRKSNLHLLMYVTDWRFTMGEPAVTLARVYCARRSHGFKSIAYFSPTGLGPGDICQLFPPPGSLPELGWLQERDIRGRGVRNIDPSTVQASPDGNGIVITVPPRL